MSITEEQLHLIGAVIAWMEGDDDFVKVGQSTLYQDSAQQFAEEAGLA